MQEMKVYTRTGDDGTTSLFSGKRVPKHDLRIKSTALLMSSIAGWGLLEIKRKMKSTTSLF